MSKKLVLSMSFVAISSAVLMACNPTSPNATPSPSPVSENSTTQNSDELAQAIMAGGEMQCTISNTDKGESIQFLTKDKKMKVSTTMTEQNENTYMVSDTQYLYIWTEGQDTGIKSRVPSEEEIQKLQNQAGATAQPQNITDFSQPDIQDQYRNQGYSINCQPAQVSDGEFVPPTDVTFQDMSALMDGALKMMQSANESN